MTAPSNPTDCGRPDLLAEARAAHQRGWSLTPLKGKVPMKKGWQKAPSSTETDLECWASQGNLGLRTGPASGVVVIDDDTEDGSGAAGLGLPTTVTVETGSGKRHYYFKQPEQELGNSTGSLPEHVDVRGDGGQVVFVGSLHPDTGQPYRWVPGLSPDEVELAALPQNVIDLINTPKKAKTKPKPKAPKRQKKRRPVALDQNAEQALADAASAVSTATEGTRNKVLNAEAFRVGRWVNTGLLSRAEVETALVGAATSVGLSEGEAASTVRSGLRAGEASPSRQKGASDPKGARAVKPAIIVEGGALPEIVTKAEQALLKSGVQIFQRGSVLVQAIRAPAMTIRDVYRRTEGVLMISEVEPPHLVEVFTSVANWFTESRGHLVLIDCPERVARTYVARTGKWRLRYLLGVIEAPTLRPDGSILATPGYDSKTCLLFDPGSEKFPEISEAPTREDALAALDQILTVIAEFEFLEESDRSAVVAAILTALIRPSLRSAPMFAFRAPKMASGKSLLGDVVAMIATGRTASVMTQGKDEDEDKKRLLAVLMEGISVACIDNIEHDFGGAAMCSVLTQETWRDRILGKTGTATVPTNTTWIATGNNIRFVGDITTRVVLCDLDPTVERPEERVYQVNLHKYVPEHRAELVVAGLTVLRAFHVAGLPSQGLRVFGRFEEWSDRVRSALVWLGLADPCLGRARIHEYDPVGRQLKAFLVGWYGAANDAPHDGWGLHQPRDPSREPEQVCGLQRPGSRVRWTGREARCPSAGSLPLEVRAASGGRAPGRAGRRAPGCRPLACRPRGAAAVRGDQRPGSRGLRGSGGLFPVGPRDK